VYDKPESEVTGGARWGPPDRTFAEVEPRFRVWKRHHAWRRGGETMGTERPPSEEQLSEEQLRAADLELAQIFVAGLRQAGLYERALEDEDLRRELMRRFGEVFTRTMAEFEAEEGPAAA
jgi:hypothetical protein